MGEPGVMTKKPAVDLWDNFTLLLSLTEKYLYGVDKAIEIYVHDAVFLNMGYLGTSTFRHKVY